MDLAFERLRARNKAREVGSVRVSLSAEPGVLTVKLDARDKRLKLRLKVRVGSNERGEDPGRPRWGRCGGQGRPKLPDKLRDMVQMALD
jgi:hypothetical protein